MSTRTTRVLVIGILIPAMAISALFILLRGHVVVNRYTDATWHMVVADEFARTGIFGKDPFIPKAPRFAQFGLWDFINGLIERSLGLPIEQVFVASNAVTVALFLLVAYLAGAIATGRAACGLLSLFGISVTCAMGETTLVRAGWPFALALSLYFLLLALLSRFLDQVSSFLSDSTDSEPRRPRLLLAGAFGLGLLLGTAFATHAFVGLFGGLALCVVILPFVVLWRHRWRQLTIIALFAGMGALLISAPWLVMHLSLRGGLKQFNAHMYSATPPGLDAISVFVLMLLALIGLLSARKIVQCSHLRRLAYLLGVSGLLSVLTTVPVANSLISSITSTFMAERVLSFLPSGLLVATIPAYVASVNVKRISRLWIIGAVMLGFMAISAPLLLREATTCYYMWRTTDYDTHEYEDLRALKDLGMAGHTILSDGSTSYFARRFLGTYAVTVGAISPAVDYRAGDNVWQLALHDPTAALAAAPFDYVVINKRTRNAGGEVDPELVKDAQRAWSQVAQMIYDDQGYAVFMVINTSRTGLHGRGAL